MNSHVHTPHKKCILSWLYFDVLSELPLPIHTFWRNLVCKSVSGRCFPASCTDKYNHFGKKPKAGETELKHERNQSQAPACLSRLHHSSVLQLQSQTQQGGIASLGGVRGRFVPCSSSRGKIVFGKTIGLSKPRLLYIFPFPDSCTPLWDLK